MPATTSEKKLPYPLGTDRVMDGDDQIRKLAQSVDNMVQAGAVTITIATNNTPVSQTVTFPVAFSAAPIVNCTVANTTAPQNTACGTQNQSATTANIYANRATAGNVVVHWVAVGPVTAVA